jgi:hypothetical protein
MDALLCQALTNGGKQPPFSDRDRDTDRNRDRDRDRDRDRQTDRQTDRQRRKHLRKVTKVRKAACPLLRPMVPRKVILSPVGSGWKFIARKYADISPAGAQTRT